MAKMIERPSGLWARHGPGSGAVDRTISDVPLKVVYEPLDSVAADTAAAR